MRPAPLSHPDERVVIVGAGLAGLRVAEGLRGAGFPGRIVLVGEEPHEPYDRPPLSKAVLEGDGGEAAIRLVSDGALDALGVELRLGRRAVAIDRLGRRLELDDGERLPYERLVLATGSRVRRLELFAPDSPGVFYLRSLEHARALRTALLPGRRLAVIGGGVIGMEVAATARTLGCAVTVIEAATRVMARAASPTISTFVLDRHRREGVEVRLGETVTNARRAAAFELRLSGGDALMADLVVVGVGVAPNLELARDAGLDVDPGGVIVDGHGATSDPSIYAAGEVAVHWNAAVGRHDRQETWSHASVHGEHVGRSLFEPDAAYAELGSYWSDQYDVNLQTLGAPQGDCDVVRGDLADGRGLVFHIVAGRIVGVSAVCSARELRKARRSIGAAAPADLAVLADPRADLPVLV